ncbi:MAG: hypothetical protein ACI97K_000601 [Glaciecola sp.]|jgi:hypothetical protein
MKLTIWINEMQSQNKAKFNILVSLATAGLILLSSYLLGGTEYEKHADVVMFAFIGLWFIPFCFINARNGI